MTYPAPVLLGTLGPVVAGNIADEAIDIARDLVSGEAVSSVAFTVTDATGVTVPGVVVAHTDGGTRTDFRITAPAAGIYTITAIFTIDDGQQLTRTATLWVV